MLAKIQRDQIHLWEEDAKDMLQLGIQCTEYPALPTYGIRVDVTGLTTKPQIKAAIIVEVKALVSKIEAQMQKDATVRGHFDSWGWSDTEFETDNL